MAPREVCVRACVCDSERERDTAPPLTAQGVNTVDYNEAPLTDLLLPSAPPPRTPHLSASSFSPSLPSFLFPPSLSEGRYSVRLRCEL